MKTGYKLKDFIDLIRIEGKARYCLKNEIQDENTKKLNEFYKKVKDFISGSEEKDKMLEKIPKIFD